MYSKRRNREMCLLTSAAQHLLTGSWSKLALFTNGVASPVIWKLAALDTETEGIKTWASCQLQQRSLYAHFLSRCQTSSDVHTGPSHLGCGGRELFVKSVQTAELNKVWRRQGIGKSHRFLRGHSYCTSAQRRSKRAQPHRWLESRGCPSVSWASAWLPAASPVSSSLKMKKHSQQLSITKRAW